MNQRTLGVAAALFYIFLWASAFVPSKIGALDSSPLWFLVVRFATAGAIALAASFALGVRWPRGRSEWLAIAAVGILSNAVYLGCTYEALRHMGSGVGAIVASTNPLTLALVAPWLLHEPLTVRKAIGLLLGFGGVVAIMIVRTGSGTADPLDIATAFVGVLGSVASTIVFKRWCAGLDLRAVTALQLLVAGLALLPLAIAFEGPPHATWTWQLLVSFAYVVLVMSFGASLLWFWLLTHGEASRVSAYYFLTPVFGLALAALLLHEPVGVRDLGGLVSIALGIAIVQRA
ncbi:DMT family transporter [Vulcanimicrobium alpinum]|uniref:DMT family transporter n=1 Tax=Vulcanimicrobium alpinum TaxID=3016050 RepID=UPI00295ED676|nr:DMT family transporter [Vulcanimicrobium alpinum]